MTLSKQRAARLLRECREQKILVIGDLMLDRYIYGSVSRISPEAPVPVVRVTEERSMPGGACNVAWNVRSLGARAAVAGVLGRDLRRERGRLARTLEACATGGRPRQGIALAVGDRHDGVVERSVNVRNAFCDILLDLFADARSGFSCHG